MRRLLGTLIATLMITSSQASTIQTNGDRYADINLYVIQPRTATRNARVHVGAPRIPKFKLLRTNPYRLTHFIVDDSDDDSIDDDSLITAYRRRDLTKIEHLDGISERVRWKLFLARQLAMMKYREINS